jgi:hypothetical protein
MPEVTGHGETGYRYGCRCAVCRTAKAADTRSRRHDRLYGTGGPMSPATRRAILKAVRGGASVIEAARAAGVTHQRVYRAAQELPAFGEALDKATG